MLSRRRQLVTAGVAAVTCPALLAASPSGQQRVVWLVSPDAIGEADPSKSPEYARVRDWFASHGFVDGGNLALTIKAMPAEWSEAEAYIKQLVASSPAVIMTVAMEELLLLQRATRQIPIVFYNLGVDPAQVGLVESLRRPGGNLTGTTLGWEEIQAKQMQALKALVPRMKRLGLLFPAEQAQADKMMAQFELARKSMALQRNAWTTSAARLGIDLTIINVRGNGSREEFEAAVRAAGVDAVMAPWETPQLIDFLKASNLPSTCMFLRSAGQGVLMAVSFDWQEGEREAVAIVARILRGGTPATLPIYRHKSYGMAVNRTTAKALGLTIPSSILLEADKIFD